MSINQSTEINGKNNVFVSSDLALAAIVSLYFPIVVINKDNPKKAVFVFNKSSNLTELVDNYWNGTLLVEPRKYFDSIKALKARLYANE